MTRCAVLVLMPEDSTRKRKSDLNYGPMATHRHPIIPITVSFVRFYFQKEENYITYAQRNIMKGAAGSVGGRKNVCLTDGFASTRKHFKCFAA